MDNMKVNNKRLQKLILDTQKSVGQLSKLAYETGVQDGLIKANALNALNPLDNTSMRWIPCSERLPEEKGRYLVTNNRIGAWIVDFDFYDSFNKKWYYNQNVVAWLPTIAPYEERKEQ